MLKYRVKKADTNESEPQKAPVSIPEAEGRSILPGESDDNAFRKIHPRYLRRMYDLEKDPKQKELIWHALKQWARQYTESLIEPFPYKRFFDGLEGDSYKDFVARPKNVAARIAERIVAEVKDPVRNLFYYQDDETNSAQDWGRNDGLGYNDPWVGGSEGNKDPMKWEKWVYPEQGKWEQNRPEEQHSWGGPSENFAEPYEGPIKKNLKENEGNVPANQSIPENDGSGNRFSSRGKNMSFFDNFVWVDDCAIETVFKSKKASLKKVSKIVKLADLSNFIKVSNDLLIHKSDKDLWAMETDDDGNIVISRLFDGDCL